MIVADLFQRTDIEHSQAAPSKRVSLLKRRTFVDLEDDF